MRQKKTFILTIALLLAACGKQSSISNPEYNRALSEASSQAAMGSPTNLSPDQQLATILDQVFPKAESIVIAPVQSSASTGSRGAVNTWTGTLANGATFTKKNGYYYGSYYSGYAGGSRYQNPTTGATANGVHVCVPGIGCVAGGLAYNPQTGKVGFAGCYGSLTFSSAGCAGCTNAGCTSF